MKNREVNIHIHEEKWCVFFYEDFEIITNRSYLTAAGAYLDVKDWLANSPMTPLAQCEIEELGI